MANARRITARLARELPVPEGKQETTHWDGELSGLGLRVYASGRRVWIVRYRVGRRQRFLTLGTLAELSPEEARRAAARVLAEVRLGKDPRIELERRRAEAELTFGRVAEAWLAERAPHLRPKTLKEYRRYLEGTFGSWHRLPVADIDRATVAARIARIARESGPVAANRARAALSACFVWAMRSGLADANPAATVPVPPRGTPRDRVLDLSELAVVWRACEGAGDLGDIVRLLALTGCRFGEIAGLRWQEVDFERERLDLPPERTKNRRRHLLPLSAPALDILRARPRIEGRAFVFGTGRQGFSGVSAAKRRLDARITALCEEAGRPSTLPHWTLHDIRRSVATHLAELGVQPHVVEAVLNHVSGHRASVAGVYNRATYEGEMRTALRRWAEVLLGAVSSGGEVSGDASA